MTTVSEKIKKLHIDGRYKLSQELQHKKFLRKRLEQKNQICKSFGRQLDFNDIDSANKWLIDNHHIELLDDKKVRLDKTLLYQYVISPDHPLANKSGKVYYHRYIKSLFIGRYVKHDEHVHHIDENKSNNNPENLQLVDPITHTRIHIAERLNLESIDDFKYKIPMKCQHCSKEFTGYRDNESKFCSLECASNSRKKFDPSKEELERLVWQMPTTKVAEIFGVSDKAITKRCTALGITKPPRGYWAKVQYNKL